MNLVGMIWGVIVTDGRGRGERVARECGADAVQRVSRPGVMSKRRLQTLKERSEAQRNDALGTETVDWQRKRGGLKSQWANGWMDGMEQESGTEHAQAKCAASGKI